MVPNSVGSLSKRPRGTQSKNSGFSSQNRTAGASASVVTASVSPPARAAGMPTTTASDRAREPGREQREAEVPARRSG